RSLADQVRCLRVRLEYHLFGNHLLANAKALVFAALFFDGAEPKKWLDTGLGILQTELPEQILADGGHFERSPMYHAPILEALLDPLALGRVFAEGIPAELLDRWKGLAGGMLTWLGAMSHPDGGIAFFNDAAMNFSPTQAQLLAFADA